MRLDITIGIRRAIAAIALTSLTMTGVAACGGDDDKGTAAPPAGAGAGGVDDGSQLTLWTRAPLELQAKALVEAYNASHKNQVALTIVPNDDYVSKVGAAAGSGDLPDLFAADIVYVPNWAKSGLFADLTDSIAQLPYADKINKAHLAAGTYENKKYVLPFVLDLSVMFWNKDLYKDAGLDPEKGPATLAEFKEQALAVQKLNKPGVNGTYFGGNCGGCVEFTLWPSVWAAGGEVLDADGRHAKLDSAEMAEVFALYRSLYEDGVAAPASKDEAGPTWLGALQGGKVGIAPGPSVWLGAMEAKGVKVGVAPITGITGGDSTFIGGDTIGIGATSAKTAQAWDFLAWTMSDEAQVEVVAKNKGVPTRTDLASNKYSSLDPRLVTINSLVSKGRTPYAQNFNASFNDAQSPWLKTVRGALFGDADKALSEGNSAITKSLQQG